MQTMIEELMRHKWWANTRTCCKQSSNIRPPAEDEELRKMLNHILVSNRFWLLTILERPFDREDEMQLPAAWPTSLSDSSETERLESEWLSTPAASDLERTLETHTSRLGIDVSVRQAILQICVHTQGHRSQCASATARPRRHSARHGLHFVDQRRKTVSLISLTRTQDAHLSH